MTDQYGQPGQDPAGAGPASGYPSAPAASAGYPSAPAASAGYPSAPAAPGGYGPGGYAAGVPSGAGQGLPQQSGRPLGKQRIGVAVPLLSLITLGIYWLVYLYKTHAEIKRHSAVGLGGGPALVIAIFLGFLSPFLLGNDVRSVRTANGLAPRVSWATGFWTWLPLIGVFVFTARVQNALNDFWVSQGAAPR